MERIVKVIGVEPYLPTDTIIRFTGEDIDTGEAVVFGSDHRPAQMILEALSVDEEPMAVVPDYMVLSVPKGAV